MHSQTIIDHLENHPDRAYPAGTHRTLNSCLIEQAKQLHQREGNSEDAMSTPNDTYVNSPHFERRDIENSATDPTQKIDFMLCLLMYTENDKYSTAICILSPHLCARSSHSVRGYFSL